MVRFIFKLVRKRRVTRSRRRKAPSRQYVVYKEQARALVLERLAYFNTVYRHTYQRVTIRNQKTRWGSCSRAGNLSFNYRIALLPPPLVDYVIVHELCHLAQMNHSPAFWKLVEQTIPEYRARRNQLRKIPLHSRQEVVSSS